MDQASTNVVIGEGGDTQTVVITNSKAGSLVIDKRDSLTGEPLEGVTFKVTTSTGEYVPDENGYISSNGLYKTDKDGKIQIDGVVGTLVVTETATIPGYSIDPATQTQTVQVNPNDTQTLTFYNTPSTTLVIEKYIEGTTTPLEGVTFLVTDSSGAVVGPSNGEYITDENGRIVITDLEPGTTVTAREVKALEGYVLDTAPKSIEIKAGEVQTLRFYNEAKGTLVIRKLDSVTHEPLAGVEFELTYAEGGYVDDANGHLSSKGLYKTNENGEIMISRRHRHHRGQRDPDDPWLHHRPGWPESDRRRQPRGHPDVDLLQPAHRRRGDHQGQRGGPDRAHPQHHLRDPQSGR